MRLFLSRVSFLVAAGTILPLGGCLTTYTPTVHADERPKEAYVSHSVGGTHWRTFVDNGTWFQGFGGTLPIFNAGGNALYSKTSVK